MSNPARIGQEAPDLKTPSSPSRITPTRALDDTPSPQGATPISFHKHYSARRQGQFRFPRHLDVPRLCRFLVLLP